MHYDTSDSFLTAGFAVVKEYDPKTYARMSADEWTLTTNNAEVDYRGSDEAFGTTWSDIANGLPFPISYINETLTLEWSQENNVHPTLFLASVLVHEFTHAHQSHGIAGNSRKSEPPAFRASSVFAAKLPGHDGRSIRKLSDETLAHLSEAYGE